MLLGTITKPLLTVLRLGVYPTDWKNNSVIKEFKLSCRSGVGFGKGNYNVCVVRRRCFVLCDLDSRCDALAPRIGFRLLMLKALLRALRHLRSQQVDVSQNFTA